MAAGGAGGGGSGGASSKEAWNPKEVADYFSKPVLDARGNPKFGPDMKPEVQRDREAEDALLRYAAQRGITDWKQANRMMDMERVQKADEMAALQQNQQALAIARDPNLTREQKAAAIRRLQGE